MPYLLYARKSQESEERQIQSIEDQLHRAREFARAHGLTVLEEITESKSAKEPGRRPGFARLLGLIEKGAVAGRPVEGILAWHPDRLSRNEVDAAALTYLVRKGRLRDLKFVTYTFDNSPEGMMMLQMALSQSQYYSSKLARDVQRGMQSKAEKGWCPHRAPEGYRNDVATRTVIADPERFALVRRAWDLMLRETHTVREVVEAMNGPWGYVTRQTAKRGGGPLSLTAAYLLFHNPYYTGYFVEKGVTHKGLHPPMVTAQEFRQVQQYLAREGKPQPKKRVYAYTGFIRCARCGCQVTAEATAGRQGVGRYVYYHCTGSKGGCSRSGLREEALEAQIDALLARLTIDPEVADCALDAVSRWQYAQFGEDEALQSQQQASKADVERQLDALLTLKLRGLISDAVFGQKQAALEGQVAQLDEGLSQAEGELSRARTSAVNAVRFMRGAREKFLVGGVYEKREIAQALGLSYGFDGGTVTIEPHPALAPYLLLETFHLPPIYPVKRRRKGLKPAALETGIVSSGSNKKAACAATFLSGGRYGTRTCDLHNVNVAL